MNVPRQKFKNKQPKKKRYHSFHFEGEYEKYNAFWHHRYYFYLVDYLFKYRIYYTDFMDVLINRRTDYVYNNLLPMLFPVNKEKSKQHVSFVQVKKEAAVFAIAGALPYLRGLTPAVEVSHRRFSSFDIISTRKLNIKAIKELISAVMALKVNGMPQSGLIPNDAINITTRRQNREYIYTVSSLVHHIMPYIIPELYIRTLRALSMLKVSDVPNALTRFVSIIENLSGPSEKAFLSIAKEGQRFPLNQLSKIINYYKSISSKTIESKDVYGASYIISNPHSMKFTVNTHKGEINIYADTPKAFYQLYRTFKYNGMHAPVIENLLFMNNNNYLFLEE